MDITYQPGQAVPAGNYIVILRRVEDENGSMNMPVPSAPANVGPGNNVANVEEDQENNSENIPSEENNSNNNIDMMGGRKKMGKMTKVAKKTKKAKGTRKLSPYMKFAQQARPQIIKNNPNLKSDIIAVGRKIGEMWRALSDSEKAKY